MSDEAISLMGSRSRKNEWGVCCWCGQAPAGGGDSSQDGFFFWLHRVWEGLGLPRGGKGIPGIGSLYKVPGI